jgi:hypothetical protein
MRSQKVFKRENLRTKQYFYADFKELFGWSSKGDR